MLDVISQQRQKQSNADRPVSSEQQPGCMARSTARCMSVQVCMPYSNRRLCRERQIQHSADPIVRGHDRHVRHLTVQKERSTKTTAMTSTQYMLARAELISATRHTAALLRRGSSTGLTGQKG